MDKTTFLDSVMKLSNINNVNDAERITTVIFQVLRSQISDAENHDIFENLPDDLEPLWQNGLFQRIISRILRLQYFNKRTFIEQVREAADIRSPERAEQIIRAVFTALKKTIPGSETEHIHDELSNGLLDMWDAA